MQLNFTMLYTKLLKLYSKADFPRVVINKNILISMLTSNVLNCHKKRIFLLYIAVNAVSSWNVTLYVILL